MADLLWSDPAPPGVMGRSPSKRGVGVCFGPGLSFFFTYRFFFVKKIALIVFLLKKCILSDVTKRFLDANNLQLLIRSHEVKDDGYYIHPDCDNRLFTVFSAPNYW